MWESPSLPGLLAKLPWTDEVSERPGEGELTQGPQRKPSSLWPPRHTGREPRLFLAAVAAAELLLPAGMCDRPKCSWEMPRAGLKSG